MRKKGIVYSSEYGKNDFESLKAIKRIGFDSIMLGWYAPEHIKELVDICYKIDILPEAIHAPFSHINDMWLTDDCDGGIFSAIVNTVKSAGDNGIPYVVLHLSSGDNAPYINDLGVSRFDRIIDIAIKNNVTIAFENQRKLANIAYMMEKYDDCENVGFCWDNGHEACFAGGREYMPLFGKKLVYTHIHDNFAQKNGDLHLIPFDGNLDFKRYSQHIKNSGYAGTLLLETTINSGRYAQEMTPDEFLQRAFGAVSRISDMCDT